VIPQRTTTTQLYYDEGSRQASCELLYAGSAYSPASTCSAATGFERMVARTYRDSGGLLVANGNPVGEATSARGESEARTVGTSYSASNGYFPNTVTDGFGKSVNTTFDSRFGVPTSMTDANQLTTSTTLDAMGRPLKMTPPSTTAYERCGQNQVSCPTNAVARVVSSQWGSPQSITYMDSLGRTIRTAAKLLESKYVAPATIGLPGVPQLLDDSDATVIDMIYNERGQIMRQYEPDRGGANLSAYTHGFYLRCLGSCGEQTTAF
jgi:hypothetical protein